MLIKVLTLDLAWIDGKNLDEGREKLRRGECLAVWDLDKGLLYVMEEGEEKCVLRKPIVLRKE